MDKVKEVANDTWNNTTKFVKDHKDQIIDVANKVGRGIVVGAIGAAVVVVVALAIGVSAPVIIGAAVLGVTAGVVYSFVSGDNFSFTTGILTSAVVALAAVGGGLAIARSAVQAGVRAVSAVGQYVVAHKKTASFIYGINLSWQYAESIISNGGYTNITLKEHAANFIIAGATTLVTARVSAFISTKIGATFAGWKSVALNSVVNSTIGTGETVMKNLSTKKEIGETKALISGFAFGLVPLGDGLRKLKNTKFFSFLRTRQEKGIGTTTTELNEMSSNINIVNKKKKDIVTKSEFNDLYITKDSKFQGNITPKQADILKKNDEALLIHNITNEAVSAGEKIVQKEASHNMNFVENKVEGIDKSYNEVEKEINEKIDNYINLLQERQINFGGR